MPIARPMSDDSKHICARLKQFSYVIRIVLPVGVRIATRRPTAHGLPVEIEQIIVMRRDIHLGEAGQVCDNNGLPEINEVVLVGRAVPEIWCRPFTWIQSRIEKSWDTIR